MANVRLGSPATSFVGLLLVVLLHAAVFAALLRHHVVPTPPADSTLSVDLFDTPAPIPAPQPVPKRATLPARPATPATPVAPIIQSTQREAPATPLAPPSTLATSAPTEAARAPAAPPSPAVVAPPRFDADYLNNPKPAYPPLARRLGEQGRVVLRVMVSAQGRVADIVLHASSGSPRLDQAALDAVGQWRFVPARQGDETIAATVLVPIAFTLKE